MSAKLLTMHPKNPEPRKIAQVVDVLKKGGVIIYPTDTVYGLGCDIFNPKAIERVRLLKGMKSKSLHLSFICHDLSHLSEYARSVDTPVFKLMKRLLPGPYTFILNSSFKTPKILNMKKKTVGIRVPDNNIPMMIVEELGNPIVSTSIHHSDEIIDYETNPEFIYEEFENKVDLIIDGGMGNIHPSTIIDCSSGQPEIVREGLGEANLVY